MALVDVPYTVTVIARVDTENKTIARVTIEEDVTLDVPDNVSLRDSAGYEVGEAEQDLAIQIAEDTDWPVWDHGW